MPPAVEARYSLSAMPHPRRSPAGAASPPTRAAGGAGPGQGRTGELLRLVQGTLLAPEVRIGRRPTASHIGNAILREGPRGARLAKERKDSPRRIDAGVVAVMGHDRAGALAGAVRESIYI